MVEKGIKGVICHSIYQYTKANNNYMKDYDKNKESSYIQYWDLNNLYGWEMSQKLPVNNFEDILAIEMKKKKAKSKYTYE